MYEIEREGLTGRELATGSSTIYQVLTSEIINICVSFQQLWKKKSLFYIV